MRWSVVVTVLSIACLTTASTYLNLEVGPRSYIPSRDIELQFLARNLDAPLHDLLRRTVTNSERILKPNSSGNIPKKVSQSTPTEQQTEPIPPTSRSQKNKLDAPSSRNLLDKACKAAPKQSNKAEDAAARDDQSSPLRKSNVKMGPNQALSVQKGKSSKTGAQAAIK